MKYYYMIDFSAFGCMFEIRVNDISVITLNLTGQASSMVPVNMAILKAGKQTVEAKMLPLQGKTELEAGAELKYSIKMFDVADNFNFVEQKEGYQFDTIDPDKKLPLLMHQSYFEAKVPYTLPGWEKAQDLKDIEDANEKLIKAYKAIAHLIESENYEGYQQEIAQRENRMAVSMYLDEQEKKARFTDLVHDFKSGFKIMPLGEDVILMKYGYGKIASLKRTNGEPALYLFNEATGEELSLDLDFYIPEGKDDFKVI